MHGQDLIGQRAKAEQIGTMIGLVHAAQLLRGHVAGRPGGLSVAVNVLERAPRARPRSMILICPDAERKTFTV